jgi:hypothetical protein
MAACCNPRFFFDTVIHDGSSLASSILAVWLSYVGVRKSVVHKSKFDADNSGSPNSHQIGLHSRPAKDLSSLGPLQQVDGIQ